MMMIIVMMNNATNNGAIVDNMNKANDNDIIPTITLLLK